MGMTTLVTVSYGLLLIAFCFCVERKIWDMAILLALFLIFSLWMLL